MREAILVGPRAVPARRRRGADRRRQPAAADASCGCGDLPERRQDAARRSPGTMDQDTFVRVILPVRPADE